jgi:hypothetical protein
LNRAANTYWTDDRLRAQRVAARALPSLAPVRDLPAMDSLRDYHPGDVRSLRDGDYAYASGDARGLRAI